MSGSTAVVIAPGPLVTRPGGPDELVGSVYAYTVLP